MTFSCPRLSPSPSPEAPCHFLQNKGFTGKPFPFLGSACCNPPSRAAVTGCRAPISTQHCLTIPKPRICLLCVPGNSRQGCQGCQKWHRSHRSQQPNSRAVISPAAATTLTFASQTQETFQHAPSPHSSIPSTQAAPAAERECTGTESPVRFVFQDVAVCSLGTMLPWPPRWQRSRRSASPRCVLGAVQTLSWGFSCSRLCHWHQLSHQCFQLCSTREEAWTDA